MWAIQTKVQDGFYFFLIYFPNLTIKKVFNKYVFLFSALVEIVLYFGCPTQNSNLEFTIGELCKGAVFTFDLVKWDI